MSSGNFCRYRLRSLMGENAHAMPEEMTEERDRAAVRAWLDGVIAVTGLSPSALAVRSGLAASTLTKFLRGGVKHVLSTTTLTKVASYAGVPLPMEVALRAALETDPAVMRIALDETRRVLAHCSKEEVDQREAETLSQIYDVLMETLREGRSINEARGTIRHMMRRQTRALQQRPKPPRG